MKSSNPRSPKDTSPSRNKIPRDPLKDIRQPEMDEFDAFENALKNFRQEDFTDVELLHLDELYSTARQEAKSSGYYEALIWAEESYGELLSKLGKHKEAIEVLERCNKRRDNTSGSFRLLIPAYLNAGREENVFRTADVWSRHRYSRPEEVASWLIRFAVGQRSAGNPDLAERLLKGTEAWAKRHQLSEQQFQAWNERGNLAETEEDTARATSIYREAIRAGSKDKNTIQRLLILLETNKQYAEAVEIAAIALKASTEVAWEAEIGVRLARLERMIPSKQHRASKPIPVGVIREGDHRIELSNLIAMPKSFEARSIALADDGESIFVSKSSKKPNNLVCLRQNGEEVWRASIPGPSVPLHSLPGGGCFTYVRRGRLGDGGTDLYWFDALGNQVQARTLPDVPTEARGSDAGIVVGCRDGNLYFFDEDANLVWRHKVPESGPVDMEAETPYRRPCPWFIGISKSGNSVTYTSYGSLTYVDQQGQGKMIWEARAVEEKIGTSITITRGGAVYGLIMSADGRQIATPADDGYIHIINSIGTTVRLYETVNEHGYLAANGSFTAFVFSHSAGIDFYDHSAQTITHSQDRSHQVLVSPDGGVVAAWSEMHLRLFDISGAKIGSVEFARKVTSVVFRSESEVLVAAGHIIRLRILEMGP